VQLCAAKRSAATLSGRDAFAGSLEGEGMLERG
jgi:hypothetical protein